ncbi:Na(+)-translocating NADH-quinone reductase subunit F [Mesonia maritima]|uniref:Na(+)-translocating NADH-quinone reductase subunit F n=1 Tax=Mesonia maritima TaxID=1793873 RepID=A0ABU1K6N7_9FLAO|nr:Na(+)-translocating NADH-quinone reductase subunit F [Mesonia maritima]MDR6301268.1 hypothetical protein [Mesonia maritima]
MAELDEQTLHNLAMNTVGKKLQEDDFEFLAVNSKLKKDPQFVALKNKKLHFIIVRAIKYPENPEIFDLKFMNTIKDHAQKFNAKTYYAGVGIANSTDYDQPVNDAEDYVINYKGLKEI